jgi:hypothetical protein
MMLLSKEDDAIKGAAFIRVRARNARAFLDAKRPEIIVFYATSDAFCGRCGGRGSFAAVERGMKYH